MPLLGHSLDSADRFIALNCSVRERFLGARTFLSRVLKILSDLECHFFLYNSIRRAKGVLTEVNLLTFFSFSSLANHIRYTSLDKLIFICHHVIIIFMF